MDLQQESIINSFKNDEIERKESQNYLRRRHACRQAIEEFREDKTTCLYSSLYNWKVWRTKTFTDTINANCWSLEGAVVVSVARDFQSTMTLQFCKAKGIFRSGIECTFFYSDRVWRISNKFGQGSYSWLLLTLFSNWTNFPKDYFWRWGSVKVNMKSL